jgi:hypothetical protein
MPRFHVHDSVRPRYLDDQEAAESVVNQIMERLDRIEQAIAMLAQGNNGDDTGNTDQQPQPTSPSPSTSTSNLEDRNRKSKQLFGSLDAMIERGNLSRVDPDAYDPGTVYPDDKTAMGPRRTNDTFQSFRDRFLSRNPINPNVVSINAANRRRYG